MKPILKFTLFLTSYIICNGLNAQSLNFEELNGSTWLLTQFHENQFYINKEIQLIEYNKDKSAIRSANLTWSFYDSIEVDYFDPHIQQFTEVARLKYGIIDKNILRIYSNLKQGQFFDYIIGEVSSGRYIVLYRKEKT